MGYRNLRYKGYEADGGVAVVTIDRPGALNALNQETLSELGQVFETAGSDAAVRVVILTGAGDRAFAAGADIRELSTLDRERGAAYARAGQIVFDRIADFPKPVIAAINGYALGGGCELALACTVRIAADNAQLGQPEVRLGLIPGFGGTQRLPRLVGRARALELLLTGEPVTAATALRIGLVDRVVPHEGLMEEARALAGVILRGAPPAVRRCLEAVREGASLDLADAQRLEARLFGECFGTEDMKEGTQAFLEKREARFQGR